MAIKKKDNLWLCSYCGKEFSTEFKADKCRDDHELIYVPISKTDLNRLVNFLFLRDETLLTPTLTNTLTRYLKGNRS